MSLALTTTHENCYFQRSIGRFFETLPRSHNTFALHCGVWIIDCRRRQAYNVFVIMAPCEC